MDFIEKLYKEDREKYVKLLTNLTNNYTTSEDIVQQAFLQALQYKDGYKEELGAVGSWFSKILFNTYSKHMQKENKHNHLDLSVANRVVVDGDTKTIKPLFDIVVGENFTFKEGIILLLIYYKGYTIKEVGCSLHTSESLVKKLCSRFNQLMRN